MDIHLEGWDGILAGAILAGIALWFAGPWVIAQVRLLLGLLLGLLR